MAEPTNIAMFSYNTTNKFHNSGTRSLDVPFVQSGGNLGCFDRASRGWATSQRTGYWVVSFGRGCGGVICSDCCLINGSNTERRVCLNQSKQYLGGLGKSNPARKKCYTTLQGPCPFQFAEFWLPFCSITGISLMPLHKSRHDDTVIGQEAKEKPPY